MLEKVILQRHHLKRHLLAPLLKEREDYLQILYEKGYKRKSILRVATYMLRIIELLGISDENNKPVSLKDILNGAKTMSSSLINIKDKQRVENLFIGYALLWLPKVGCMDSSYNRFSKTLGKYITKPHTILKYMSAPLFDERMDYLEFMKSNGYSDSTIKKAAFYQLMAINYLKLDELRVVSIEELVTAAEEYTNKELGSGHRNVGSSIGKTLFVESVKGWLRFANVLIISSSPIRGESIMETYFSYLLNECGYSGKTIRGKRYYLKGFLKYLQYKDISLKNISLSTIDEYIQIKRTEGCRRKTIESIVGCIRVFIKYLENNRIVNNMNLSCGIKSPRIYKMEDLPSSPPWSCVEKIIKSKATGSCSDMRDYAILLLLTVYGLRCSEVTDLKLADIDWEHEKIRLHRAKSSKPQLFPLHHIVGEAIVNYLTNARYNDTKCPFVFRCLLPPYRKMSISAVYKIVSTSLKKENVLLKHYGPHSLRHACATKLINEGFSFKEIADVLGHQLLDTTCVYAKVDLTNLRKVADMNWKEVII